MSHNPESERFFGAVNDTLDGLWRLLGWAFALFCVYMVAMLAWLSYDYVSNGFSTYPKSEPLYNTYAECLAYYADPINNFAGTPQGNCATYLASLNH